MNLNPYDSGIPITEERLTPEQTSGVGPFVFVCSVILSASVSIVGFAVAESFDEAHLSYDQWGLIYLPTLLIGFSGSIVLLFRARSGWQRISASLAILSNIASGFITAFLWLIFSIPHSTG